MDKCNEYSLLSEVCSTCGAQERSFSRNLLYYFSRVFLRVVLHVELQVVLPGELGVADLAGERPLLGVHPDVGVERRLGKKFVANGTFVSVSRLGFGISFAFVRGIRHEWFVVEG